VAHADGQSGAVLLRALEPTDGLSSMNERRRGVPETQLARGPGSLGQAMGILLADIGTDILAASEWELRYGESAAKILAGPRIGISRAVRSPWRFFEYSNPHVSRHRKGDPVERHELPSLIPPTGTPIE
jgi:DNA-3-methyladenine glycosylase